MNEEVNIREEEGHEEGQEGRQDVTPLDKALSVIDDAVQEHRPSHIFALFSGGHDSLANLAVTAKHPRFTGAAFINTGTGIPRTVEFVRQTCEENGWKLVELHPDAKRFEDLIRLRGFGHGPKSHNTAYYWLKQRQVRRLVGAYKRHRHDRIMLTTGVRTSESVRRMGAKISVPVRRDGAQLWVNPILDWSGVDVSRFVDSEGLKRNPVVDTLHRSGECLCGTLFKKGERDEILLWAPEMKETVERWEAIAAEAGHPNRRWGVSDRQLPVLNNELTGDLPLCTSCEARV